MPNVYQDTQCKVTIKIFYQYYVYKYHKKCLYLQITTKVGGPDLTGDEGYHILYVSSSHIPDGRKIRDHRNN